MFSSSFSLSLALFTVVPLLAQAVPCVQFDASFNLYAFGGSQDVKIGAASTWGSPSVTPLTTSGRPPWTGNFTQCLLSQFNNALYVLGADSSDLTKVYVYDFAGNAWSSQSTSSPPPNLGNSRSSSILDHDTNVIFTLPTGAGLFQLDLSSIKASASTNALGWEGVTNPSFQTTNYQGTLAEASNHINFFGVPGTAAGSANLFVVHYATFQPAAQAYPTKNGGAAFPDTPGQAISVPDAQDGAGNQMIFVPNDFSNTYLVTHWTNPGDYASTSGAPFSTDLINSTQILPPPTSQDQQASYAASASDLVQIDTAGNIYYIAGAISNYQVASGASWTKLSYTLPGTGGSGGTTASASASSTGSASASAASGSASSIGSAASRSSSAASSSGSASASAAAASASKSGGAGRRAEGLRLDLAGLTLGLVAVGAAVIL